jgi:2-keto-4-pentenoate hydratase
LTIIRPLFDEATSDPVSTVGDAAVSATANAVPTSRPEDIAGRFVTARLTATATPDYPGVIPETMAEAYAIQDAAIGLYPDRIVGWKVGGVPPALQPKLGVHRVAGPVFAGNVWTAGDGDTTALPVIEGGFAAVEAEFIARIAEGVDTSRTDWTVEQAREAVDAVFIGIELAGSSLPVINDLGSAVVASDFGNNGGMIIGPELTDWQARLDDVQVETVINGESVGTGGSPSLAGGALESVRFLLEHSARRGRPLSAGTLVLTGAVTGVHRAYAGDEAVCAFAGAGDLKCKLVTAEPRG